MGREKNEDDAVRVGDAISVEGIASGTDLEVRVGSSPSKSVPVVFKFTVADVV